MTAALASQTCARCGRRISRKALTEHRYVFSRFTRSYYCWRCCREVGKT